MNIRIANADFTRPNDTTPYTAADVVGNAAAAGQFGVSDSGGANRGRIRSAVLIDSSAEATKPDIDLLLFDAAPTVAADNAAFEPTDAEMKTLVGVISFAGSSFKLGATTAKNGAIVQQALDLPFVTTNGVLYGVLVARNAYTPIASEVFTVRLGVET